MTSVDPTARVSPAARLAQGVVVGPGAILDGDVQVGSGSEIGPYAVLLGGTSIGAQVVVGAGSVLGGLPQDLKFRGGDSGVEIGDRTVIREHVTVHRCVEPDRVTRVGSDCLLMASSHVAHECVIGRRVIIANGVAMAGHVTIDDGAFVSGNVVVHQFARIGRLAMVGGGSAVRQDIVPFCMSDGHPARLYGLNRVGLRRAGVPTATRRALQHAYRLLFASGLTLAEALGRLDDLAAGGEPTIAELAAFVRGSSRGVARPARRAAKGDASD